MPRIINVIFDIGNVLISWDPRRLYEKLIPDPAQLDYFLTNIVTLDWHSEHDRGRSFADGAAILSQQFPDHAELINAFDARWNETLGPVHEATVEILKQLVENGISCYGLTNFSAEKYPEFEKAYSFTSLFKGVVVSGAEKLIKPDPRIFQLTLDRYNLTPENTLFIDDRAENVQAAQQLGLHGYIYDHSAGLRHHMSALGLL